MVAASRTATYEPRSMAAMRWRASGESSQRASSAMETPWAFATAASEPREVRSRRMEAARASSGVNGELGGEAITSMGNVRTGRGRVKAIFGMCEDV